jgi:hypothetical protein
MARATQDGAPSRLLQKWIPCSPHRDRFGCRRSLTISSAKVASRWQRRGSLFGTSTTIRTIFFLVLSGRIIIQLRDGAVRLGPGEVFVVPKGVEHRPVAEDEAHILLIEPRGTPNTGNTATAAARRVI